MKDPLTHRPVGWILADEVEKFGELAPATTIHQVDCAWCNKVMRPGKAPISHSICPECKTTHFSEIPNL